MIRRIFSAPERLSENYYGAKINAFMNSYGFDYDFCRFYGFSENGGGVMMKNNGNLVIDGCFTDAEELLYFLTFEGVVSVESPHIKDIKGYAKKKRYLLEKKLPKLNKITESANDFAVNEKLECAFEILKSAFENIDHDLWYADTSHRIRHNMSNLFLYNNAAVGNIQFCSDKFGFLSDIAVIPEYRGKGFGKNILDIMESFLKEKKLSALVYAYSDKVPFYVRRNYEIKGYDTYFTLKGKT